VPVIETAWGELATESVNIKDAERAPVAPGVKVRVTVQLALAANVLPQVVEMPKSAVFVPVSQMLRMLSDAVPALDSVTFLDALTIPTFWFPNETLEGLMVTFGIGALFPVPLKAAVSEVPAWLSELPVTVSVPVKAPDVAGTKARATKQSEPAGITDEAEQSVYPELCWWKLALTAKALRFSD
jgi:hypothetical protein